MTAHVLPDLPYKTDAFAPLMGEPTLAEHHQSHHRGYVDLLNRTEEAMAAAKHAGEDEAVAWAHTLGRQYAFAMAGHRLHSLFWRSMIPGPPGDLSPSLASQVRTDFGDLARCRALIGGLAGSTYGSGWVVLAFDPAANALRLLALREHEDGLPQGLTLLLALDVWEHAYYLDHRSNRAGWVNTFMHDLIDWPAISERFDRAKGVAT